MSRAVMQQAIDALIECDRDGDCTLIDALRDAMAQPEPVAQPLTDSQILGLAVSSVCVEYPRWLIEFARAIERAHKIGGAP